MSSSAIVVVGAGYVGLATGACLASLGHRVVCVDSDAGKIDQLRAARVPMAEPGLAELVAEGLAAGRLDFTVDARAAARHAEFVYLCLPTPMGLGGAADLRVLETVLAEIGDALPAGSVVVNKSTVPVGTAARTRELLGRRDVAVVSNPEFLREGSAVRDVLRPDRIVVGSDQPDAAERVAALYAGIDAPLVVTDASSAELVKYASNCFLAIKLSYVNAMAELCERLGADIEAVTDGMGHDHRIGRAFLAPGPGWGGSCLPKDVHALLHTADTADFEFRLLRATVDTNTRQTRRIVDKIRVAVIGGRQGSLRGARIGLLGLTFKAGTDDLRDSPALAVAGLLRQEGAVLTGHDPAITEVAGLSALDGIAITDDPLVVGKDADAVVVLTEWPQFRGLDWAGLGEVMRRGIVVDARNLLDREAIAHCGLAYHGLGVPSRPAA